MADTIIPEIPRMAYRIAELEAEVARLTVERDALHREGVERLMEAEAEVARLTAELASLKPNAMRELVANERKVLEAEVARLRVVMEKFVRLRAIQREYFKHRQQDVLIEAKQLEREVDAELDALAS